MTLEGKKYAAIPIVLSWSLLCACEEQPPPWAGEPDGRLIDESEPFLPPETPSPLTDLDAGDDAPLPEEELLARPEGRRGGAWLSCHQRFVISGEPRRDVTRLALSCGPITGMHRASGLVSGSLAPGESAEHRFASEVGHCHRIFAAGGPGIDTLDVRVVEGSNRREIAHATGTGAWVVVEPERPFCTATKTDLTMVLDARGGSGAFAAEVWSIPPRKRGP